MPRRRGLRQDRETDPRQLGREDLAASPDEIVREGARRMLAAALEDEVAAYIAAHAGERDENGGGW